MILRITFRSVLYFLKHIWLDILLISIYAITIIAIDHFTILNKITIPSSITTVTGTIVALLLTFRTSQSYDRWWEACRIWGEIVSDSRTLMRQIKQQLPKEDTDFILKEFAQRQIIWCLSLSETLRRIPYSDRVAKYLEENKISSNNIPAKLLNLHSESLAHIYSIYKINPYKQVQIDSTLLRLNDSMGKCERIKNTVFPRSYSLLIHFLIYALASILPFGLDNVFPAIEIWLAIMIPIALIAVEETAIIMQDPFENRPSDIPMSTLCNTIERNINEIISNQYFNFSPNRDHYYIN